MKYRLCIILLHKTINYKHFQIIIHISNIIQILILNIYDINILVLYIYSYLFISLLIY